MSRKLKKTLALVLSLVTVFSAAFTSMADEVAVVEGIEQADQIMVPEVSVEEVAMVEEVKEVSETGIDNVSEPSSIVSAETLYGTLPDRPTIAEILGTVVGGFPTSSKDAWVNESGKGAVFSNGGLNIGLTFFDKDTKLTKGDDNTYKNESSPKLTFNMVGDTLQSIQMEGNSTTECNGIYALRYTVTYNANGATSGTAPTDSTRYVFGASVQTDASLNLKKTGCNFNGWNTKADGTGTHYEAGGSFTITANTTLYAEWKVPSITLTADKLGCVKGESVTFTATVENVTASQVDFVIGDALISVAIDGEKASVTKALDEAGVNKITASVNEGISDTIEILVTEAKPEITMSCEKRFEVNEEIELSISTTYLPDGTDIIVSDVTEPGEVLDTWTVTVKDNQAKFKGPAKTEAGLYFYKAAIPQFDIESTVLIPVDEPSQKIDLPTADPNSYTYNGENRTYSPAGFAADKMVMTNGVQKDAGTYEVKVSPAEGYAWAGGAADPTFTWSIQPAIIGGLQWYTTESKSYDGKALDTGIKGLDGVFSGDDCKLNCTLHKGTADGEVVSSATEVGIYVCVTDKSLSGTAAGNYMLSENITLPLSRTYTITPGTNPKPDPTPVEKESEEHEPLYTGTWNAPVKSGSWSQDAHGIWHYASSETFRNTWGYIYNPYAKEGQNMADWFWFDRQGNMLTGWQFINGKWYYLNPTKDGTLGACQLGGVTPDGWTVDESGAWIESIPKNEP